VNVLTFHGTVSQRYVNYSPTMQQTFLALGVATLGGLYTELAAAVGPRNGFLMVVGLQALLTVGVVLLSRRLPDPRA
jgi:hypothetical protein